MHLTVRDEGDHEVAARLAAYAAAHRMKSVHILLDHGEVPSQPMLTLRGAGTYEEVRADAAAKGDGLRAAGFDVLRTKIEATPWSAGVPGTDEEAAALGPGYYFEHHLKLVLARSAPVGSLLALVVGHGAHLSRNARRARPDGRVERFVTQRCRGVGRANAGQRLDALSRQLRAGGHHIAAVEREFVVHDGNLALDAGWMDEECVMTGERAAP
ncbi:MULTISPECIES: hypothetical protein [unclassified Streptomyces]|uniref:hypothetical protein n=1 Tax=unclassified Streptomyces TaxID=2593676 RepID=UPI000896FFB4|nr:MULTISPECIES: hypothetical protein [unclassified Streptomyces]SED42877.1 hypothetical protein SAMN05428954_0285 [Streptomyces sp. 2112.3]